MLFLYIPKNPVTISVLCQSPIITLKAETLKLGCCWFCSNSKLAIEFLSSLEALNTGHKITFSWKENLFKTIFEAFWITYIEKEMENSIHFTI